MSFPLREFIKRPWNRYRAKIKGRHKVYDGKWIIGDTSRLEFIEKQEDFEIYTATVNYVNLKHDVRIAYLVKKTAQGFSYAVLFSTDTELDALSLVRS